MYVMLAKFIETISTIFTPILGILAASGVLKGVLSLCVALNWLSKDNGTYILLYSGSDALFYFLPIILGYTAGVKFGGNPYLGMLIGAALIHPNILLAFSTTQSGYLQSMTFLGLPLTLADYSFSVIPVIFAVWISSKLERYLNQIYSNYLATILTPLTSIIICIPITFLVVGPIATQLGSGLSSSYQMVYSSSPLFAGLLIGLSWEFLVLLGLHWFFVPIIINNLSVLGFDSFTPLVTPVTLAQAGATFGIYLSQKDPELRPVTMSSFISAAFGITKPAIFGINLPQKYPFVVACIIGGLFGAIVGYLEIKVYSFSIPGILVFPQAISPTTGDSSLTFFVLFGLLSLTISAGLTYFISLWRQKSTN